MTDVPRIRVACGALQRPDGEVLIAQRPPGKIAAGEWEFPGGKIEPGEGARDALVRELSEELGVRVTVARPLIALRHDYSDRLVELDVWKITAWDGDPHGREGQALAWCRPDQLQTYPLLGADGPIVQALCLPEHYVFTPADASASDIVDGLDGLPIEALLRLRLPGVSDRAYRELASRVIARAAPLRLRVLLDREPGWVTELGAWGWHASGRTLRALQKAPDCPRMASVHDDAELALARALGFDGAVLGSVLPTRSHPGVDGMGWDRFASLARGAGLPVYAIGGLDLKTLGDAFAAYAQGIAGITAYW
ncbi:MAG: Nudix family hydrolase [Nevskiales bacterium]|nr:Nudix family hydrolase [Nevskiales bacterium]